jgi:hypothetical protein
MKRHNVTLSEPLSQLVSAQVKSGRYKDFSAALQDAAWNYFVGLGDPFAEYGVTAAEVEAAAKRDAGIIARERAAGKLKIWKPRS